MDEPKVFLKKLLIFENVLKCPQVMGDVDLKSFKVATWTVHGHLQSWPRTLVTSMLHESYKLRSSEVLKHFNCDAVCGLTSAQVQESKEKFGINGINDNYNHKCC